MKRMILRTFLIVMAASSSGFAAETWMNSTGDVGQSPVFAGYEGVKAMYVCRASGIPGKLIRSDKKCYIGYYGKEMAYTNFQFLQDPQRVMSWVHKNGAQNNRLVFGGWENGIGLWLCKVRTQANGEIAGKLVPGSATHILEGGKCYYGLYGKEFMATDFDVLTY